MDFKEVVAISGLPGLYKAENQRKDGMIVSSLDGGDTKFVSSRQHMFTPLETITVYTEDDSVDLYDVFMKMKAEKSEAPNPKKDPKQNIVSYFETVLPEYDKEQVYLSDMKKIIKWFAILDGDGGIDFTKPLEDEEEDSEKKEKAADTTEEE